jgi:hypothetical protein
MFLRKGLIAALCLTLLSSCSSLITAYLVNELLNDKSPKFTWRGTVTDSENRGIANLDVRVRAEVAGDDDVLDFTGKTNDNGQYQVVFKYSEKIDYRVTVLSGETVLAERLVGKVGAADQRDDFTITGNSNLEVSGVVRDASGDPIEGALVIAASSSSATGTPVAFTNDGAIVYDETSAAGVFTINGAAQQFITAVAYHPEHGFAYATGEEDGNELALNFEMGAVGSHTVRVQVVNGLGIPLGNQVLDPARQFRLRLSTPADLSEDVDAVVADAGLFDDSIVPSDLHPAPRTITVQSTGADGIADSSTEAIGGTYRLEVLEVDSNEPATAVINSDNPLPLADDTTVVVRVN